MIYVGRRSVASQFLLATCPTCVAERPVLASCTLAQTHRRRMHRGHVTRTLRAGCLRAWCMRDWRHLSSVRGRFECDMEPKFKRPVASSRALAAFTKGTQLEIQYAGAPSGVDANLLVLLHGLGDTSKPFFRLGEQLQRTLPQTAILSVQAPIRVPLLDEDAWMWWDSFDSLGEVNMRPDPRHALRDMRNLFAYLTEPDATGGCGWSMQHIHAFGFAQGGTVLLESLAAMRAQTLGSATSVCGPLLSLPTYTPPLPIPVCFVTRSLGASSATREDIRAVERGFRNVTHVHYNAPNMGMIQGKEWGDIMRFWSPRWRYLTMWELEGEVHEVS